MPEGSIQIGKETITMYSLRHLHTGMWLNICADGGIRLDSPEPLYLGTFYDAADADTEAFAYQFLDWLQANAGLDHVTDGRFIDIHPIDLSYTIVCRFVGERPLLLETTIEPSSASDQAS